MIDIYSDGRVLQIEDFRAFRAFGCKAKPVGGPDKGHAAELSAFHHAVRGGAPWPITLDAQLQAMDIAFRVEAQLQAAPGGAEKQADLPP
jgi:predicted dehydrogenase